MAQTRLKSGNLHMIGGDNGSSGNVLKSKGDGTFEWGPATTPPSFSSVDYPGDDTALDPAGGQNLVINGGGFVAGINVKVGGTNASSVTVNSVTQITIVTPAKSAGTYAIEFTNTDGGNATANSAVSYNGIPAFTHNAGSRGTFKQGETVNTSVVATEPDGGTITHTITSGSLPSGLSLNATTGAITGTAPDVSASTTSSFTITATDNENQSTSRAYSIQIDPILPSDDFNVLTYTGNGGTQTITGLSFQPDFVWLKRRNSDAEQMLNHPNIGIGEYYRPSYASQGRLTRSDVITSLNSNGFSLGAESITNNNNDTYVAYCWKVNGGTTVSNTDGTTNSTVQVNADKGISMITYSGAGADRTVGHGLGKVPELFFMMDRYNGGGWRMWHKSLDGANKYLEMGTGSQSTSSSIWQNTLPTSSVFYLGNVVPPNGSGRAHVCWAFTSIDGHSSFDSYAGNGSSAGPIVELGFKPALLIIRRIDSGDHFYMFDSKRETSNPRNVALFMNSSAAESTGNLGTGVDFLSNGFQVTSTDSGINANGGKYIYMAWAQDPDATTPALADSFNIKTYTGTGNDPLAITGLDFEPSLTWIKTRTQAREHIWSDIVRGPNKELSSSDTTAEEARGVKSFDNDGFTLDNSTANYNNNGENYVSWNWKANDDEPTIFPDNAVAVYKFEDNANDVGGNHNGTASNISYTSDGKFNKAATFNGTSSVITLPSALSDGSTTDAGAISFWMNVGAEVTSSSANNEIMAFAKSGNAAGGKIALGSTTGNFGNETISVSSDITDQYTYSTTNIPAGWNHIVISWNSANTKWDIYVNKVAHETSTMGTNQQGKFFLKLGQRSSYYFDGKLDQIRLFDKPLNQYQVNELYNETASNNNDLTLGAPPKSIVSANTNAGFSIVKYTGNGVSTSKVPHGLGGTPEMIIHKRVDGVSGWIVNHHNLSNGYEIYLQSDNPQTNSMGNDGGMPNGTQNATTLGFQAGASTTNNVNTNGAKYIAYCFRGISGYSKFGTYTGATAGVTITTGFQPDFVMIKSSSHTEHWAILDATRGSQKALYPNRTNAESNTALHTITFSSTGFSFPHQDTADAMLNENGYTYIYAAFKIN
tara:strand:+ start:4242 stop:7550 length:3309 start_codon:yes stop_codon:yes gene_type:complete